MSSLDSPDYSQDNISDALMLQLKSKTGSILSNVSALLESGAIENEVDRKRVVNVAAFIEKPTDNLQDIMDNTISIGEVVCGYDEQGIDAPAAINTMHAHLLALQVINRMSFVETQLENGTADSSNIKEAISIAINWTTTLSKSYKDDSLLNPVNELKNRAEQVTGGSLITPRLLAAFQKVLK